MHNSFSDATDSVTESAFCDEVAGSDSFPVFPSLDTAERLADQNEE